MEQDKLNLLQEMSEACDELDMYDMMKEADVLENIMVKIAGEEGMVKAAFNRQVFQDIMQSVRELLDKVKAPINLLIVKSLNARITQVLAEAQSWLTAMSNKLTDENVKQKYVTVHKDVGILKKFQNDLQAGDYKTITGKVQGIRNTLTELESIINEITPAPVLGKY